jgi:hypothetical protein
MVDARDGVAREDLSDVHTPRFPVRAQKQFATVWRVHPAGVEVCDATGTRALAAPCRLSAAVLARPLPWPLTPAEPAAR